MACCGVGWSSGVRLRQDEAVVETVGAGALVWQVRLSCVDILVREMVVAWVLDLQGCPRKRLLGGLEGCRFVRWRSGYLPGVLLPPVLRG